MGSVARKARARLQTKEKRGLINSILCTVCMYVLYLCMHVFVLKPRRILYIYQLMNVLINFYMHVFEYPHFMCALPGKEAPKFFQICPK